MSCKHPPVATAKIGYCLKCGAKSAQVIDDLQDRLADAERERDECSWRAVAAERERDEAVGDRDFFDTERMRVVEQLEAAEAKLADETRRADDNWNTYVDTERLRKAAESKLAAAERELAEERAPLTKEEWEQLFSLATGASYPTKTPDACLIRGLQAWAKEEHGRVAMRRLLEEYRDTATKLAAAESKLAATDVALTAEYERAEDYQRALDTIASRNKTRTIAQARQLAIDALARIRGEKKGTGE